MESGPSYSIVNDSLHRDENPQGRHCEFWVFDGLDVTRMRDVPDLDIRV